MNGTFFKLPELSSCVACATNEQSLVFLAVFSARQHTAYA